MNEYREITVKQYPPSCPEIREIGRLVVRVPDAADFDNAAALDAACELFSGEAQSDVRIEPGHYLSDFVEERDPDWDRESQPAWIVAGPHSNRVERFI